MGSVQSGKTGNYTGLVAKAIDWDTNLLYFNRNSNSLDLKLKLELMKSYSDTIWKKYKIYLQVRQVQSRCVKDSFTQRLERNSNVNDILRKGDFKKKQATSANPILARPHVLIIKKTQVF